MKPTLIMLLLLPSAVSAETTASIDLGGQAVWGVTESSKFEEYKDEVRGVYVDNVCVETSTRGYYMSIRASKPSLADQRVEFSAGEWGLHRVSLIYDELPHRLSNTARSMLVDEGGGKFSLPDGLQTSLQTAAANAALFWDWSPSTPLRIDRKTGTFMYEYNQAGAWRMNLSYSGEHRSGRKNLGISYGHGQVQEVLEPVDYLTHVAALGIEHAGEDHGFSLRYELSDFQNNIKRLLVDNPQRLTDSAITAGGGSNPGLAQAALPPDNRQHQIAAAYTRRFGTELRFDANLAYAYLEQNDAFLPLTANRLILADPRLPKPTAGSLNGEIETWDAAARLNWRPWEDLTVNLKGRHRDLNNRTPSILFRQYVPYDSTFSVADPTTANNPTRQRRSVPIEYTKTNAGADFHYVIARPASVKVGYDWEQYKRPLREVGVTNEHTVSAGINVKTGPLDLRPSYAYSRRMVGIYNHEHAAEEMFPLGEGTALGQFQLARRFDVAARTRHKGGVKAEWRPSEAWEIGVDYGLLEDDYEADYGVTAARTHYYTLGFAAAAGPRGNFYGDYTWEQMISQFRSRYRATGLDLAANDWLGYLKDVSQTFNLGTRWELIPDFLDMNLDWLFTYSKGRQESYNPSPRAGTAAQQASALATDLPITYTRFHRAEAGFECRWTERIKSRLGYEFQRYNETDWAQDDLNVFQPAWNTSVFLGAAQPSYDAHLARVGFSYQF